MDLTGVWLSEHVAQRHNYSFPHGFPVQDTWGASVTVHGRKLPGLESAWAWTHHSRWHKAWWESHTKIGTKNGLCLCCWKFSPTLSNQAPQLFPRLGSDWFLHKESMGKNYHVSWSSSIKAGRDAEGGWRTPWVSLFHWWLGLFLLKVILCPTEHRNQSDILHHAFNFRRESMTHLLWGHGTMIPGYLKKKISTMETLTGRMETSALSLAVLYSSSGHYSLDMQGYTLKFNQYGKSNFPLFISEVCEWHTYLSKHVYFVYGLFPLIFVQQRWEFISKSSPENEEVWASLTDVANELWIYFM